MSLLDLGNALEAKAQADSEHNLRVFLNLKLREIDKGTFESVPCPMPEYADVTLSQLPELCRREAAVYHQLQKKCIPAAERMLNDPVLNAERIKLYGLTRKPMLQQDASGLRSQCEGAIEQLRTYPQLLERWAAFIEKQKSPLRSEPHNLAWSIWGDTGGIKHYVGSTGAYEGFCERILKAREELEKWGAVFKRAGLYPARGRGN